MNNEQNKEELNTMRIKECDENDKRYKKFFEDNFLHKPQCKHKLSMMRNPAYICRGFVKQSWGELCIKCYEEAAKKLKCNKTGD